jgi:asparagine synthase (glutamine-hydrolysing)
VVRKAGITVALSGLGGDELFGGYPSFARLRWARWLRAVPQRVRHSFAKLAVRLAVGSPQMAKAVDMLDSAVSPLEVYTLSRWLFAPSDRESLCPAIPEFPPPFFSLSVPSDADPFLSISLYEMGHYMANTLLRDTDCMSMAHGLEVRVPFVDREVVRTVLSVPSAHKVDGRRPKPLLLDAIGDLLPEEVWRRPKMGFNLPFEHWMLGHLASEIQGVLSEEYLFKALGLNPRAVQEVWKRFQRNPRQVGWSRPWALYVLGRWSTLNGVVL